MKNYITNKRKCEPTTTILSICFWIVNFTFAQICTNMFVKVISAGNSDWLDEGLKRQLTSDPFIINKTEMVMNMLMALLMIIMVFVTFSIIFYRNIQLKNVLSQIGIYRVLGYNRKQILDICMFETFSDMLIALPLSFVVSVILWNCLAKVKIISFMMAMMYNSIWLDISAFIMSIGIMVLIAVVHTKFFVEKSLKKGVRYMLGLGGM